MRKSTTDLSDSELLTLKCIWDAGRDLSAAEIRTSLKDNYDKAWEPPTVCTFLARIESKGYISVRRKPRGTGKGYLYHPLMDEAAYREQLQKKLMDAWFDGSISRFVETYLGSEKISEEEAGRLKELVFGLK